MGLTKVLLAVSCSPRVRRQELTLGDSAEKGKGLMQGLHNRPVCKKTNVSTIKTWVTEKINALKIKVIKLEKKISD